MTDDFTTATYPYWYYFSFNDKNNSISSQLFIKQRRAYDLCKQHSIVYIFKHEYLKSGIGFRNEEDYTLFVLLFDK